MNAFTTIDLSTAVELCDFNAAEVKANVWRAECLQIFSRAEAAISQTLAVLAAVPIRGKTIKLHQSGAQRYEALRSAIGDGGVFGTEGKKAWPQFDTFSQNIPLRNALAHGVDSISVGRDGAWTMVVSTIEFRDRQTATMRLLFLQADADLLRERLQGEFARLAAACGQLRKAVSPS